MNNAEIVDHFKDYADRLSLNIKSATNKNYYLAQLDGAESFAVHLLAASHEASNVHIGNVWQHAAQIRAASFGSPAGGYHA